MRVLIGIVLTLTIGLFLAGCNANSADSTTTNNVKDQLSQDPTVKNLDISVDTDNGVVTLSGTVNSQQQRMRAVQIARSTDGVTRVDDKLEVNSASQSGQNPNQPSNPDNSKANGNDSGGGIVQGSKDTIIEGAVKTKLMAAEDVSGGDINVDVDNGVVTLTPKEGKHPNMKRAAEIARGTTGVKSVVIK
jgi:hyperosmotically inducible protein